MHGLFLSLILAFAPPTAASRNTAIDKVRQASQRHAEHDDTEALKLVDEAIAADPSYSPAFYTRGALQLSQQHYAAAKASFEQGVKAVAPEHPLRRARMSYGLARALDGLARAETSADERSKLREQIVTALQNATRDDPSRYRPFAMLGRLLDELDRPTEADAALRKCIELAPEHSPCFVQLASMYADYGHAPAALMVLDAGTKANPTDIEMHIGCGRIYLDLGKPDEALESLNKAKAIDPTRVDVLYALGMAYAEKRDHKLAIENLQAFLARAGSDVPEIRKRSAADTLARLQDPL